MKNDTDILEYLPKHSWLRRYALAAQLADKGPWLYHFGVGLALLASTCPPSLRFPSTREPQGVSANMYVLLLWPPTQQGQTSTVLQQGRNVAERASIRDCNLYGISGEGLFRAVSGGLRGFPSLEPVPSPADFHPGVFAWAPDLLRTPVFPERTANVMTMLADCWDGRPILRVETSTAVQTAVPCLGVAATANMTQFVRDFSATVDFSRFLVLSPTGWNRAPELVVDSTLTELVSDLRARVAPQAAPCAGLGGESSARWFEWLDSVAARREEESQSIKMRLSYLRAPEMAKKLALLFSWDFGLPDEAVWRPVPREGAPWGIPVQAVDAAIAVVEHHLATVDKLLRSRADR